MLCVLCVIVCLWLRIVAVAGSFGFPLLFVSEEKINQKKIISGISITQSHLLPHEQDNPFYSLTGSSLRCSLEPLPTSAAARAGTLEVRLESFFTLFIIYCYCKP